jgi:hypothetical protein
VQTKWIETDAERPDAVLVASVIQIAENFIDFIPIHPVFQSTRTIATNPNFFEVGRSYGFQGPIQSYYRTVGKSRFGD